ncbi:anti-sigma factor domain-containing protein [Salipaludibacillus sp. LMS25]|jgi:hypothetical protein|uniref:anti-sigma factor domain-containing protein n=1 Tax=Salipaludibacillus sp. LMS25 TaxID=2924031 RepID=UPI0020D0A021|nr:anti-sigma factor domain-containing protein [Salipaludibacillus sp. LMS25]UTR14687.1 anti-sigma factor domain-containing protein [Salipaludibacillus sp. LMS25]
MKKGVVMEVRNRHIIVMTKDGEFIRAKPDEHAHVGEEVEFSAFPLYSFYRIVDKKLYSVPLTFTLIILLCLPFGPLVQPSKVYGIISLDMNPSIEMAVNEEYEVIYTSSYDKEGQTLLADIDTTFKGMTVSRATNIILEEGYEQGILNETSSVYITSPLAFNDPLLTNEIGDWSSKLSNEVELTIYSVYVDDELVEKAREQAVSPLKMLLLSYYNQEETGKSLDSHYSVNELIDLTGFPLDELTSVTVIN